MSDLEKMLGGVILAAAIAAFWKLWEKISSSSTAIHNRIDAQNEKFVRIDDFKDLRREWREDVRAINSKLDRLVGSQPPSDKH